MAMSYWVVFQESILSFRAPFELIRTQRESNSHLMEIPLKAIFGYFDSRKTLSNLRSKATTIHFVTLCQKFQKCNIFIFSFTDTISDIFVLLMSFELLAIVDMYRI